MLPDTSGRFGLIQILDAYGRAGNMTTSQIQSEAPYTDSVWGAFQPATWNSAHPGMILSRYYLPNEDAKLISGHDLTWFQNNHPDWILYACDGSGNPTHDLAYAGTGFGDVPLDIHNPDVVQYQLGTIKNYLQANGYNTLAVDNIVFLNYLEGPNPEFGEGSPKTSSPAWYGCGVWQGNTFVRRYGSAGSSDFDVKDPAFAADIINWLAQARAYLGSSYKIIVNHPPFDSSPDSNESQMLQYVDGMVDENGYTHYGTLLTGGNFANTLSWVQLLQQQHKAALITDYFCTGSTCPSDPSSLTPQQVDWALASYALGNDGGEDVYISPHGGSVYFYRPEYNTRYGAACGSYTQVSSYVYVRKFQGALVIVNATGSSYSYTLPSGHQYHDVEGRAVNNPLTLGAPDAYVLLTSNGCS